MTNSALVARMAALYHGLERAHGIYELLKRTTGGGKVEGKARTVRGDVTQELWDRHLHGVQGLGIVPIRDDATCYFGAIDIDKYDLRIEDVEIQVATLGLPLLPTRTKSGGVHLYVYGSEALPAALLKRRLEEWSIALGFGGSEVFPKQSALASNTDIGNWINMPYFNALTGPTQRYAIFRGEALDFATFLDRAEALRITTEQLEALAPKLGDEFNEGPPCLQSLSLSGFPPGTRNNGLFAVSVYLKKRYPDDWEAHVHSYNSQFLKPPLSQGEVAAIVKSAKRKDYAYPCEKAPCSTFCNKSVCRTREFGVGRGIVDWGVVFDSDVQKVTTDPPYWIVGVNGTRMQFFAEDLMSQRKFGELCINRLAFWPGQLDPNKWRAEVNKIMQLATEVEAPPDSSAGGELESHLKQFCTVHPQADTKEEVLIGKPWTEEGVTYFRSADFRKYLDSQHFRALTGPRLYARLRQCGVSHKQFWVKGQNIQVWMVGSFMGGDLEVPTTSVPMEGM